MPVYCFQWSQLSLFLVLAKDQYRNVTDQTPAIRIYLYLFVSPLRPVVIDSTVVIISSVVASSVAFVI